MKNQSAKYDSQKDLLSTSFDLTEMTQDKEDSSNMKDGGNLESSSENNKKDEETLMTSRDLTPPLILPEETGMVPDIVDEGNCENNKYTNEDNKRMIINEVPAPPLDGVVENAE